MDIGRCECGCNGVTNVAPRNKPSRGHVKGEHVRFLPGHNQRKPQVSEPEDLGYLTPCFIWKGNYGHGYGITRDGSAAHRVAYETTYGPIPEGKEIHHLCETKMCVRPDHLAARTWHEHRAAHNGPAKVTREDALKIMAFDGTLIQTAEHFGLSPGYVGNIRSGWCLNEFTGLPKRKKGSKSLARGRVSRLSAEDVLEIQTGDMTAKQVSAKYGISQTHAGYVRRNGVKTRSQ